jgi:hypothetical protein
MRLIAIALSGLVAIALSGLVDFALSGLVWHWRLLDANSLCPFNAGVFKGTVVFYYFSWVTHPK